MQLATRRNSPVNASPKPHHIGVVIQSTTTLSNVARNERHRAEVSRRGLLGSMSRRLGWMASCGDQTRVHWIRVDKGSPSVFSSRW
jgi:hypothetical protein